jgi:Predicted phosphatase
MLKLVVFDADKTLWDHHNISDFEEPLEASQDGLSGGLEGEQTHPIPFT